MRETYSLDDLTPARREVVEFLKETRLASPSEIAEATDRSRNAAYALCTRMVDDRQLVRPMRGLYCLPDVADDLDIPAEVEGIPKVYEEGGADDLSTEEAIENPLPGSSSGGNPDSEGEDPMGLEEGHRRSGIAKVATAITRGSQKKSFQDTSSRSDEENGITLGKTYRAIRHPWWPMRTDLPARARWWIAEKLAWIIVWLIPPEEIPHLGDPDPES